MRRALPPHSPFAIIALEAFRLAPLGPPRCARVGVIVLLVARARAQNGDTALIAASEYGHKECVAQLIAAGAAIDAVNKVWPVFAPPLVQCDV